MTQKIAELAKMKRCGFILDFEVIEDADTTTVRIVRLDGSILEKSE